MTRTGAERVALTAALFGTLLLLGVHIADRFGIWPM
jgi:hypothetical protein